ncbi:MAG: hypothetical protein AABY27_00970, partial [Pseudomonadota bacterium]
MEKAKETLLKFGIVIIVITAFVGMASAQQGNPLWVPIGKDTVSTNRFVKINESLKVNEKTTTSIMEVKDYLKVGDSALWFVTLSGVDHIRSDVGKISFMEGTNTTFSSNIQVGIGTTAPLAGMMLDVNGMITVHAGNFGYCIGPNEVLKYHAATLGIPSQTNIYVGAGAAGAASTTALNNAFVGWSSGLNNTASENSFFGAFSGTSNTSGDHNAFFGNESGVVNTTGLCNTFIGDRSGQFNTTGYFNTYVGNSAGSSLNYLHNATALGYLAIVNANNSLV